MTSNPQLINLTTLPIQELRHIVQQMQQETDVLTKSLQSLKSAQTQFVESRDSLAVIKPQNQDKNILVPLSSSLYVAGKLHDVDSVMVDVGTGYYVKKNPTDADEFFKRKIDYLKQQMEALQSVVQQKMHNKQMVMEVLQAKVFQQVPQKS